MKSISNSSIEPNDFDLESFFPYRLSVLSNKVSKLISKQYADTYGLSISEWRIIVVLHGRNRMSPSDIAACTHIDRVNVSRTLNSLRDKELVMREHSQQDGRSNVVSLTAAGENIYQAVMPAARDLERQFLAALSSEEQIALMDLLSRLDESVSLSET